MKWMSWACTIKKSLLLITLAWCGWCAVCGVYEQAFRAVVPRDVAGWRAAARGIPLDADVALLDNSSQMDSVCRYRLISVNWEICPRVARVISEPNESGDYVVSSAYLTQEETKAFSKANYHMVQSNAFAMVWSPGAAPHAVCEKINVDDAECCFGGLRPPNGLGVYAGKAKLFLLGHGIPEGFWTKPEYAVYQPSYPPGMTILAMAIFMMVGISDVGLISCIVPIALGAVFMLLIARARNWVEYLLAILYVACPLALRMGAGFYAEPLAALCLLLGHWFVLRGRSYLGWMVIGCAALFRHEALLLAGVMWCVAGIRQNDRWAVIWRRALAAFSPGVIWQVIIWTLGARVYDYDFTAWPSLARVGFAMGALARQLTIGTGALGGGVVLMVLYVDARRWIECMTAPALFIAICMVLLGFNTSPHYAWIIGTSLPRIVWLATAPMIFSLLATVKN